MPITIDPPKPYLSDSAWDLLADFSGDAQEMHDAFNKGMDVLIDPKLGFVMACCVTSITREIATAYGYIVIDADSGLVIHY